MRVTVGAYGARLLSILIPLNCNKNESCEMLLRYPVLSDYKNDPYYLGATIGRVANRIGYGSFGIVNKTGKKVYRLSQNEGLHTLHGGSESLSNKIWHCKSNTTSKLVLSVTSFDNESGFPGDVHLVQTYELNDDNSLTISTEAHVTELTPLDITQHAYFTLGSQSIGELRLTQGSAARLIKTPDNITTGESIATPKISSDMISNIDWHQQGQQTWRNLDDYFAYTDENKLTLINTELGVTMHMRSNQPGNQIYTSGGLGEPFVKNAGICIEPHQYPNSLNHERFQDCLVKPGTPYQASTSYTFIF